MQNVQFVVGINQPVIYIILYPKSQGGTNTSDNLIIVCPNCHRVIHANKKYDIEYLQSLSIDKTFANWKDFYHTKN